VKPEPSDWQLPGPAVLVCVALLLATAPATPQDIRAEEKITVARVIVDAHITDDEGEPIRNLKPSDLRIRIDGKPAEIESVDWVAETGPAREMLAAAEPATPDTIETPPPQGRLFVFFFQTDFQRASSRIGGQIQFLPYAEKFLETLEPEDRVAVLSFDSHLKFRLDFSRDPEKIRQAIKDALKIDDPPWPARSYSPSLNSSLNEDAARNAASSEEALFLVGNALRPIPGPKSLILFGWGLGQLSNGQVVMSRYYELARRTLETSRTTVFVMDVSLADYHSLEVGLGKVAADTGGSYMKTHDFPTMALDRLERSLQGHYEIAVKKPGDLKPGRHSIELRLPSKKRAVILARSGFD
jgi:VWFA-related protein